MSVKALLFLYECIYFLKGTLTVVATRFQYQIHISLHEVSVYCVIDVVPKQMENMLTFRSAVRNWNHTGVIYKCSIS